MGRNGLSRTSKWFFIVQEICKSERPELFHIMLSFASECKCLWSENMERQADKRGFPLPPFSAMFWIFEVLNSVLLR